MWPKATVFGQSFRGKSKNSILFQYDRTLSNLNFWFGFGSFLYSDRFIQTIGAVQKELLVFRHSDAVFLINFNVNPQIIDNCALQNQALDFDFSSLEWSLIWLLDFSATLDFLPLIKAKSLGRTGPQRKHSLIDELCKQWSWFAGLPFRCAFGSAVTNAKNSAWCRDSRPSAHAWMQRIQDGRRQHHLFRL